MTPLQEAQQAFYARRPWVMWWIDLAGTQQDIRFTHEEGARKSSRVHNNRAIPGEQWTPTYSQVTFDPKGERFPRDD